MGGCGIGMTVEEICTPSSSGGALDRCMIRATGRVVNAGTSWEHTDIIVGSARKLRTVVQKQFCGIEGTSLHVGMMTLQPIWILMFQLAQSNV